jgi:hypothetical protein
MRSSQKRSDVQQLPWPLERFIRSHLGPPLVFGISLWSVIATRGSAPVLGWTTFLSGCVLTVLWLLLPGAVDEACDEAD